jgi:hypothetical protein
MIESAVRALLLADAAVAALVGARIHTGIPPQRPSVPYVTLKKIDKLSGLTLSDAVGPNTLRLQVDCWAGDGLGTAGADNVRALADAVNGSDDQSVAGPLHGFGGRVAWTEPPAGAMRIKLMRLLVERSTEYEPDAKLYRVSADYAVHL